MGFYLFGVSLLSNIYGKKFIFHLIFAFRVATQRKFKVALK